MKFLSLLLSFFLLGCSSLTKEECFKLNWRKKGYEDAYTAYPNKTYEDLAQHCSEYGVAADRAAYQRGFQEGTQKFCSLETGRTYGRKGRGSPEICRSVEAFQEGYNRGLEDFCSYRRMHEIGRKGEEFPSACERAMNHHQLLMGYRDGRSEFIKKSDQQDAEKGLEEKRRFLLQKYNMTQECTSSFDCRRKDRCVFGRCDASGRSCTFANDCEEIRGDCRAETGWVRGEHYSVNVCRY